MDLTALGSGAPIELGVHHRRQELDHPDADRAELVPQRHGERVPGGLGPAVHGHPRHRHEPEPRGHVDDHGVRHPTQVGHQPGGQVDRGLQVAAELVVPRVQRAPAPREVQHALHAGVVDEHVDAPRLCPAGQALPISGCGHVAGHDLHSGQGAARLLQLRVAPTADQHLVARTDEGLRHAEADPRRAARDEHGVAGKVHPRTSHVPAPSMVGTKTMLGPRAAVVQRARGALPPAGVRRRPACARAAAPRRCCAPRRPRRRDRGSRRGTP